MTHNLFAFTCLSCRKSFKRPGKNALKRKCPHCGETAINLGRQFKPPKLDDDKQWDMVALLVNNGFLFHRFQDRIGHDVPYPKNLDEAKIFIKKYKIWAVNMED